MGERKNLKEREEKKMISINGGRGEFTIDKKTSIFAVS